MSKFKRRIRDCFKLFFLFFKVGLFTIGGGYAMVATLEDEIVEKKSLLSSDEYSDILAVAEATPGPLAVNTATFVGYKTCGVLGSVFSTLGVVLPSFIIILLLSFIYNTFFKISIVRYAFMGIRVGVAYIILRAGIKMFIKSAKTPFKIIMFIIALLALLAVNLFALNFSTVFFIILGAIAGIIFNALINRKNKEKEDK